MHTEDSPIERTPDLVAKIRALRQQAEKQMDRFTSPADYDVRRVVGTKSRAENTPAPPPVTPKRKRSKDTEQPALAFEPAAPDESGHAEGEG